MGGERTSQVARVLAGPLLGLGQVCLPPGASGPSVGPEAVLALGKCHQAWEDTLPRCWVW